MNDNFKDKLQDISFFCFILMVVVPFISVPASMLLLLILELWHAIFYNALIMGRIADDALFTNTDALLTTWRIITFCGMGLTSFVYFKK